VAVEWFQYQPGPNVYYAFFDDLTNGGAVDGKGDWMYSDGVWYELQSHHVDGNWGLGAIVEGIPRQPPNPPVIYGPTIGIIGQSYLFTFTSYDPQGKDIYYDIYWGDGHYSDWMGPYPSGTTIYVNHTWDDRDSYYILAKAKDMYNLESDWTDPFEIRIGAPILILDNLHGGVRGISVHVKNIGDADATNVVLSIKISEAVIFSNSDKAFSLSNIPPGDAKKITSFVFGFGKMITDVSVVCQEGVMTEKHATGFMFLFFVFGIQEINFSLINGVQKKPLRKHLSLGLYDKETKGLSCF
jgi:hypothetical protein